MNARSWLFALIALLLLVPLLAPGLLISQVHDSIRSPVQVTLALRRRHPKVTIG